MGVNNRDKKRPPPKREKKREEEMNVVSLLQCSNRGSRALFDAVAACSSMHLLWLRTMLGEAGDRFGDYLCVFCADLTCVSK